MAAVIPNLESLVAGPTKQDLIFTGNILMMECQSNHLNNGFTFNVSKGTSLSRMYGPYYFHFNTFTARNHTPASLYDDALDAVSSVNRLYDREATLLQNGYVPSKRTRNRAGFYSGVAQGEEQAWVVLSDNQNQFSISGVGRQYWVNNDDEIAMLWFGSGSGTTGFRYLLGEWGELRNDM